MLLAKSEGARILKQAVNGIASDRKLKSKFDRLSFAESYQPGMDKKGYIYVRSIDRDNFPNGSPTNFNISLKSGSILKNVKFLKLESLTAARTFYNVNQATLCFSENDDASVVFLSPITSEFLADSTAVCTAISNAMNNAVEIGGVGTPANTYIAAYDEVTGKITVSKSAGAVNFKFWWNVYSSSYNYLVDAPMVNDPSFSKGYNYFMYYGGWNVPQFTATTYGMTQTSTGVATLVSYYSFNVILQGLPSPYVTTSDFTLSYYVPLQSFGVNDVINYESNNTFDNIVDLSYNPGRQISQLGIKIVDDYGVQIDLNGSEWEIIMSYELWETRS